MNNVTKKINDVIKPKELKGTATITKTIVAEIPLSAFTADDRLEGIDEDELDDMFWDYVDTTKSIIKINLD